MNDIQRIWANEIASGYPAGDPQLNPEYVLYVDYLAEVKRLNKAWSDLYEKYIGALQELSYAGEREYYLKQELKALKDDTID